MNKFYVVFDHDGTLMETGPNPFVYEGIRELIAVLKKKQIDLFIWSARPRGSLLRYLKEMGLAEYFLELKSSDDTIPKPNPAGLFDLSQGIEPGHIVHIGDGLGDFQGASALGIPFIAAAWSSFQIPNNSDKTSGAEVVKNWNKIFSSSFLKDANGKFGIAEHPSDVVKILRSWGYQI